MNQAAGIAERLRRVRAGGGSALLASFAGLVIRGGETFARFAMTLLLARRLGPEAAGVFFLCLGILSQSGLTRFALDRALIRHVAITAAAAPGAIRSLVLRGLALGVVGPAVTALALFFCAGWLAPLLFHDPALLTPLRVTALVMVPMALGILTAAVLTGLQRTAAGQLVGTGLWPAVCAVGFALLPLDLDAAFAVLLASGVAAAGCGLVLIHRALPMAEPAAVRPEHGARALLRTAWPLFPVEIVQLSLVAMPTLLLGLFVPPGEVGLFGVANRFALLLWVVIIAVNAMAGPRFAAAHAAGDHDRLVAVTRRTVQITLLAGVPPALLLLAAPEPLLALLGGDFASGAALVRVMVVGQIANLLFPCYAEMLAMTGHGPPLRTLNLVVLAICLVLCLALIPLFGAMGAAVATSVAMAANSLGPALLARRQLGIDPLCWLPRR